jgi:hypothetical protein
VDLIGGPRFSSCGLRYGRVTSDVLRHPRPWWRAFFHLLLPTLGGPCPSTKDNRSEFDMSQPPLNVGITFTQPSPWVWHVSLDGKHVGTVNGDSSCGFIARDIDYHSIGHGYVSAEAAIQACVLVMDSQL